MSMISEQIEELRLMADMFVNGEPYGNLLRSAANTIEMLSEKAREPKQGKWNSVKASIYPYGYDVECSVCGHRMGSSFGYKYCPMCGAHMVKNDE